MWNLSDKTEYSQCQALFWLLFALGTPPVVVYFWIELADFIVLSVQKSQDASIVCCWRLSKDQSESEEFRYPINTGDRVGTVSSFEEMIHL